MTDHDKRLTTLQARAALAGVALNAIADDHGNEIFIISRLALIRTLPSLNAVEQWLDTYQGAQ